MRPTLVMTFYFKLISFGCTFIILNVRDICVYFVTILSKISTINDEVYFNYEHFNRHLRIRFARKKIIYYHII